MRLYNDLPEAISEIRRDVVKSPRVVSTRVQGDKTPGGVAHEATNYGYTLVQGANNIARICDIGVEFFPFWERHRAALELWLKQEGAARTGGYIEGGWEADTLNPALVNLKEGNVFAYSYNERLVGAVSSIVAALKAFPDTRRAYWPIFHPLDAHRAGKLTRIPCSLGYQLLIREVPGLGPHLHLTYLQRSCDFDRFFLSDVYFARRFQQQVLAKLRPALIQRHGIKLQMGAFSHFILSLHSFVEGEVY